MRDTIAVAAMNAFDNSTNPNRTRGSLKKCDEMYAHLPCLALVGNECTNPRVASTHSR